MRTPPVIVGAGPAGTAAACLFGKAGQAPVLFEREQAVSEKICGCFLSVEAVAMLGRLDIDLDRLGASRIDRVRLVHHDRMGEARLPFVARGLSRRRLDGALIEQARAMGATLRTGATVTGFDETASGDICLRLRGMADERATALFLATGKHDLRGAARPRGRGPDYIGFKQMYRLAPAQVPALSGAVELHLFRGGYAGLQLVEGVQANLCLIVDRCRLRQMGGDWAGVHAALCAALPYLADRLAGAEALLDRPVTTSHIPYGFIHQPDTAAHPALYRLGDQAAVIPSFSGDGMAIALYTGMAAARCHLAGGTAAEFHRLLQKDLTRQFRLSAMLHTLIESHAGRSAIAAASGLFPPLMRWAAAATRLPAALNQ